jgi:nucleoside-triphosphatase THEP1
MVQAVAVTSVTPALLITGPPGSGTTALAKEISEVSWRAREPHATGRLARKIDQLEPPGFTVDSSDRESITELAIAVITWLGWPQTPVPDVGLPGSTAW